MSRARATADTIASSLATGVGAVWGLGIPMGIAYWTIDGDLLNAALSLVVPIYGFASVLADALS